MSRINSEKRFAKASDIVRGKLDVPCTTAVFDAHSTEPEIEGVKFYYKKTGCDHTFYTIEDVKAFCKREA